jgi:hypothetical protein
MKKEAFLRRWRKIKSGQVIEPRVVPYKHKGSTFDQDSIRITGTPQFIDSVLSRIKDMLDHEGVGTRLQISYTEATDMNKVPLGTFKCYIQVHQRGREAQIMHGIMEGAR